MWIKTTCRCGSVFIAIGLYQSKVDHVWMQQITIEFRLDPDPVSSVYRSLESEAGCCVLLKQLRCSTALC